MERGKQFAIDFVKKACHEYFLNRNSDYIMGHCDTYDIILIGLKNTDWAEDFSIFNEHYKVDKFSDTVYYVYACIHLKAENIPGRIKVEGSFICKKINGIWHFLMQAKIEPGNINYVQISPTIQATKSNIMRLHGGREPAYLRFFTQMTPENVLVDQIQSEQSSRFLGKRNRNVILKTEEEIEEADSFRWMTMHQLKTFMAIDNCVNMDTRTVLSCIPYVFLDEPMEGHTKEFIDSINTIDRNAIRDLYIHINDYKMFRPGSISFLPLTELKDWEMRKTELVHRGQYPFKVIYCNLEIEGREVTKWRQPLVEAIGEATFGLICSKSSGILEILVRLKPEIGCFDVVEIGPTVQEEYGSTKERDEVTSFFFSSLERKSILIDVVLSEEGGRFFHEQNRNVIMMVDKADVQYDSSRYVWATVGTLNAMTQINNCLNIQLRNLLTLLYMYN